MKKFIFIALLLISSRANAQTEQITVTVPVTPVTVDKYTPDGLFIHPSNSSNTHPSIDITILAPDGNKLSFHYPNDSVPSFSTDSQVTTLINQLNTANLTTASLWKRIFQRLCTDFSNKFPGGCSVP